MGCWLCECPLRLALQEPSPFSRRPLEKRQCPPGPAPPSSCATQFSGWLVCARRKWWQLGKNLMDSLGQEGGLGSAFHPCSSRGRLLLQQPPHPARPASLNAHLPLPLAPVARGQPQMAPWPWGQRPHCAQPWAGFRLGDTEPFCPLMRVRGRLHEGNRPFSCLPSPLTLKSEELTLPRKK